MLLGIICIGIGISFIWMYKKAKKNKMHIKNPMLHNDFHEFI